MRRILLLSVIFIGSISGAAVARTHSNAQFHEFFGEPFSDDNNNTVHEWVYDFLLAAEEGDVPLLEKRLKELKSADDHNYCVVLKAALKIAKTLNRHDHISILSAHSCAGSRSSDAFSIADAQNCDLTKKRDAEKIEAPARGSVSSFIETFIASPWVKAGFILATSCNASAAAAMLQAPINVSSYALTQAGPQTGRSPFAFTACDLPLGRRRDMLADLSMLLPSGWTPSSDARTLVAQAMQGERETLVQLLPRLVQDGHLNRDDLSALAIKSVAEGRYDDLAVYLKHGADPNHRSEDWSSMLTAAIVTDHLNMVELLVDYGADTAKIGFFGLSDDRVGSAVALLAKRPDFFATTRFGWASAFYYASSEVQKVLLDKELKHLQATSRKPTNEHYLLAIPSKDPELVRLINKAGGEPLAFIASDFFSAVPTQLLEVLLEDTKILPENIISNLVEYFIRENPEEPATTMARVWAALIRKGLPSDEMLYLARCNSNCGPMACALRHHDVNLMEAVLGLKELDAPTGEDRIIAHVMNIPGLHAYSKVGPYTAFRFTKKWCGNASGTSTCIELPRKLLADTIEQFQDARNTPPVRLYYDAISTNDTSLIRRLNALGANPFGHDEEGDTTSPLEYALGDFDLVEALLEGSTSLPPSAILGISHYFSSIQDSEDPTRFAGIWRTLISKGLPSDEDFYNAQCKASCGPRAFATKYNLGGFLGELAHVTTVDPNKPDVKGYTLYETALRFGYYRTAEFLRNKGGKTNRLVVTVITDSSHDGTMYNLALKNLGSRNILVATLSPPQSDTILNDTPLLIQELEKQPGRSILSATNPLVHELKELAQFAVRVSDAIWIGGGANIWRKLYEPTESEQPHDVLRDVLEFAVLDEQQRHPYKPLIGVCRGMQIINVFHGGTLQDEGESDVNSMIRIQVKGPLGSAFDGDLEGWSSHAQSVKTLADTLDVVATSKTGMIKALQSKSRELPLIGTQFHPETKAGSEEQDLARTNGQVLGRFIEMAVAAQKNTCFPIEMAEGQKACPAGRIPSLR